MTESDQGNDQITSIADAVIKLKELRESSKNLNEPDIEEKFARLSLAFKTDKFTLSKRLELQQRQRDIAEKNIESELKALRESLNALNQLCADPDMREVITKTQQHVDIVQQATVRMSSRAETYGAIQQEQRMNCAFETMLNYVEHLKQIYDKEHMELEDYRRLLAENNLLPEDKASTDGNDDPRRALPPRSLSLSGSSKPEPRARLLSAVCLLNNNYDSPRASGAVSCSNVSPGRSRRRSLPVGPMSSHVQPSSLTTIKMLNGNHECIMEHTESPKEEREITSESKKNPPLIRTNSVDSNRSEEIKENDDSRELSGRPPPIPENRDVKDRNRADYSI